MAVMMKTTPKGKVTRTSMRREGVQFTIRVDPELAQRFKGCVVLEAKLFNRDPSDVGTIRALLRQYCDRIEAIAQSPEATQAAEVLRKKVR